MFKSFLSVFLSVLLLCSLFCVPCSAAEITTLTISGSDLYALLTTGAWEGTYTVGGTTYYFDKESFLLDGDSVLIEITNNSNWSASSSLTNVNAQFNTGFVYNNVIDISIKASSAIPFTVTHQGGANYNFASFDSLTGMLVTTAGAVDLGSAFPNSSNGSYLFGYANRSNLAVNYALLQSDLDNVNVTDILFEASFNPDLSGSITVWADAILLNIAEIKLTFIDDSTSDGDSSDGTSNATQQAILNQIEAANKKLEDMQFAFEQGTQDIIDNQEQNTQDIIDNQDKNTQDIIDNQDQNTQDIIDNQDKNTQDIIDKEDELWHDTYDPSEEEVEDMQGDISDTTDALKEKLGLFTFIDDTLTQFFDLLDPAQVSSTNLVFPAFSIEIQGEYYNIWDEYEYDISSLKEVTGFKLLFDCLHFLSACIIYWALIHYLQVVFKRIFASGGDQS